MLGQRVRNAENVTTSLCNQVSMQQWRMFSVVESSYITSQCPTQPIFILNNLDMILQRKESVDCRNHLVQPTGFWHLFIDVPPSPVARFYRTLVWCFHREIQFCMWEINMSITSIEIAMKTCDIYWEYRFLCHSWYSTGTVNYALC